MTLAEWARWAVHVAVVWSAVVWLLALAAAAVWVIRRRAPRTTIEEHERPADDWPWR